MDNSKYLDVFIDESTEHLDTMYEQLILLEKNPDEISIIENIFRAAHTIKGMAATMGFDDLANLTHKIEDVFDRIRYGKLQVQTTLVDVLFNAIDQLQAIVGDISNGGTGKLSIEEIINQLEKIEKGLDVNNIVPAEVENEQSVKSLHFNLDQFQISVLNESKERGFTNYEINVQLNESCLLKAARVYMVFEVLEKIGEVVISEPSVGDLEEENFDRDFSVMLISKLASEEIKAMVMKVSEIETVHIETFNIEPYLENADVLQRVEQTEQSKETNNASIKTPTSKTIRVNMERLDMLLNLFEELVIDKGRLEQISIDVNHSELQDTVEKMSRVSSDLQHIILQMRMMPIDNVFSRFPRMIRQLARDLGKEVELEIIGSDTELDRTVIDEIGDPLVHLIRNAIDHGIEMPEERTKQCKQPFGKITLEAYHSGYHVFIEISDDGAGINQDNVIKKALEKNVISNQEAETLEDQEINKLILASGFSTNEAISDISGRGVGLDVVKNTIESLGGAISIQSTHGKGSTFSIELPLTLTIISVLLVELEKEKYGIPLSSIVETSILHKDKILNAHQHKVIDFRNRIVPLVFLNEIFNTPKSKQSPDEYYSIVIVKRGDKLTGLVVDSFIGQQEIVLKSLGNYLENVYAISGATILGDGEVALIVDSNALVK